MQVSSSRSLWQQSAFRWLWGGQTASIFGDRITDIALPWLIIQQTHSPFDAGLIVAARYLPIVSFGVIAGVLADRLDRRVVMIFSDVIRAIGLIGVVLSALVWHYVALWLLVIVVLLLGIGQLGFQVSYYAWIPDVVSEESVVNATAALEASDAISTLTGPALGGILIQLVGAALSLAADAFSYVISAISISVISVPKAIASETVPHTEEPTTARQAWKEAFQGVQYILHSTEQRLLSGVGIIIYVSSASIGVLLVTLVQLQLHLPSWQAGLIFGAAGAGGLISSFFAPRLLQIGWQKAIAVAMCIAGMGAFGLIIAVVVHQSLSSFIIAVGANLCLDGGVSLAFIITGTTSTILTPRPLRGRVFAAGTIYSASIRGLSLIAVAAIIANGNPVPAFVAISAGYFVTAYAAWRGRVSR